MSLSPFSNTLESLLEFRNKHQSYHDFILYLQHTYCLENLLFYQDVQDYRSKPSVKKYQSIITKYVMVNSPQEINIPCDMRQSLIMEKNINKASFDEVAESILELIRVNSYLPWYYHRSTVGKNRRNTLTPSLSVPEHRWQNLFTSRPSFASLRDVEPCDHQLKQKKNISTLFQRKRQALLVRVKKTFILNGDTGNNNSNSNTGFSWPAKR